MKSKVKRLPAGFCLLVALWITLVTGAFAQETATPQAQSPTLTPTPTIDRLAAPPTVPNPGQADEGAQLFWLNCQPCHGDQGQGLTDEWRAQYPPEDQNCWERGCHGDRPYENGFTLPTRVPAVIGEGSLAGFQTAGQIYNYVKVAMPYQAPGSLDDEEYLAITAFLARSHGVEDVTRLAPDTAGDVHLRAEAEAILDPQRDQGVADTPVEQGGARWLLVPIVVLLIFGVSVWGWRRYATGRRNTA